MEGDIEWDSHRCLYRKKNLFLYYYHMDLLLLRVTNTGWSENGRCTGKNFVPTTMATKWICCWLKYKVPKVSVYIIYTPKIYTNLHAGVHICTWWYLDVWRCHNYSIHISSHHKIIIKQCKILAGQNFKLSHINRLIHNVVKETIMIFCYRGSWKLKIWRDLLKFSPATIACTICYVPSLGGQIKYSLSSMSPPQVIFPNKFGGKMTDPLSNNM